MMKFTCRWLKEHLDTEHSLGAITEKLTMIGLEVERVEDKGKLLAPFIIARVVEAKQHPNADRLRVCMVDTGNGDPIQVVCGAPNARYRHEGRVRAAGGVHPGQGHDAASRHHPRRRKSRHAGLGVRAANLRQSRRHHRIARRRAGRRELRAMGGARRSDDRDQPDAEPRRLHRRQRHRPRSRRRRHGDVP